MKEKKELQLTKAEEQVMKILWELGEGLVKDVRDRFPDPKPARNTVSTVIRILERKGFVDHKAYGNVHIYFPVVSKDMYSKNQLFGLIETYFGNSFSAMASFFAKEKDLSINELDNLFDELRNELKKSREDDE